MNRQSNANNIACQGWGKYIDSVLGYKYKYIFNVQVQVQGFAKCT